MKYYILDNRVFSITEDDKCVMASHIWPSFDDVYYIEEDGEFDGKEISKGDFIVTFRYSKNSYAIVRADEDIHAHLMKIVERLSEERMDSPTCCSCEKGADYDAAA